MTFLLATVGSLALLTIGYLVGRGTCRGSGDAVRLHEPFVLTHHGHSTPVVITGVTTSAHGTTVFAGMDWKTHRNRNQVR